MLWSEYTWIVVFGCLASFFTAFGIGANDVANAFGSSVAARTLTMRQALLIAAVCESTGAIVLGGEVTRTVAGGIARLAAFDTAPELYMYGMLCALAASGTWLLLATYLGLPVSTTHSIVGAVMGFAFVYGGPGAVVWLESTPSFPYMRGMVPIVLSWFTSPLISALAAASCFVGVRAAILRRANSLQLAFWALPVLVLFTVFINAFLVLYKGATRELDWSSGKCAWVSAAIAGGCTAVTLAVGMPLVRRYVFAEIDARRRRQHTDPDARAGAPREGHKPGRRLGTSSSSLTGGSPGASTYGTAAAAAATGGSPGASTYGTAAVAAGGGSAGASAYGGGGPVGGSPGASAYGGVLAAATGSSRGSAHGLGAGAAISAPLQPQPSITIPSPFVEGRRSAECQRTRKLQQRRRQQQQLAARSQPASPCLPPPPLRPADSGPVPLPGVEALAGGSSGRSSGGSSSRSSGESRVGGDPGMRTHAAAAGAGLRADQEEAEEHARKRGRQEGEQQPAGSTGREGVGEGAHGEPSGPVAGAGGAGPVQAAPPQPQLPIQEAQWQPHLSQAHEHQRWGQQSGGGWNGGQGQWQQQQQAQWQWQQQAQWQWQQQQGFPPPHPLHSHQQGHQWPSQGWQAPNCYHNSYPHQAVQQQPQQQPGGGGWPGQPQGDMPHPNPMQQPPHPPPPPHQPQLQHGPAPSWPNHAAPLYNTVHSLNRYQPYNHQYGDPPNCWRTGGGWQHAGHGVAQPPAVHAYDTDSGAPSQPTLPYAGGAAGGGPPYAGAGAAPHAGAAAAGAPHAPPQPMRPRSRQPSPPQPALHATRAGPGPLGEALEGRPYPRSDDGGGGGETMYDKETRSVGEPAEGGSGDSGDSEGEGDGERGMAWERTFDQLKAIVLHGTNVNIHDAIGTDPTAQRLHAQAELFDPATEHAFKYLQIFTAICDSFSHGANDVANAVGPFTAIWYIYRHQRVDFMASLPVWILVMGGAGIAVGLGTYGYNIMRAIGVRLSVITPARGFCVELSTALVVALASKYGLPVSTTHCQVGATAGIGLTEGGGGVHWLLAAQFFLGWVVTLAITALLSAALFAGGAFAPSVQQGREAAAYAAALRDVGSRLDLLLNRTNAAASADPGGPWGNASAALDAALAAQLAAAQLAATRGGRWATRPVQHKPPAEVIQYFNTSVQLYVNNSLPYVGGMAARGRALPRRP